MLCFAESHGSTRFNSQMCLFSHAQQHLPPACHARERPYFQGCRLHMYTQAGVWLLSHSDVPLYAGMCVLVFRLTRFCLSPSLSLHQGGSFWAGGFTSNAGRHWWWILIALTSCCDKAKHISVLWLVARELRMASHGFHLLQGPLGLQNSIKAQSRIRLLII